MATSGSINVNQYEQQIEKEVNNAMAKIGTELQSIRGTITAHKGHFTRELKEVEEEANLAADTDPTEALLRRIVEVQVKIEYRYRVLKRCFGTLVKLFPATSDDVQAQEEEEYQRYKKADRQLFKLLNHIEFQIQNAKDEMSIEQNKSMHERNRHILRAAADIKPERIDSSYSPVLFVDWCSRFATYFQANGLLDQSISEQQAFAKALIHPVLWTTLEGKLQSTVPVVRLDLNGKPLISEDPLRIRQWTLIDHLNAEFKRLHPLITRRLEVLRSKQSHQGTLTWLAHFEKQAFAADIDNMTTQQLKLCLAVNGIKKEDIRVEVLKGIQAEVVTDLETMKTCIQSLEIAERTSQFVESGKNSSAEAFKMTAYQREKRNSYNPSSENRGRSQSRGRGGHRSPSPSRGRGGHRSPSPSRGRGRGRGFGRGRGRYRSPSPSRGNRFSNSKYCDVHGKGNHSNFQCNAQRRNQGSSRGRNFRNRDPNRSPSPRNSPSRVSHCYFIKEQRQQKFGLSGSHKTPRIAFSFRVNKNGKITSTVLPCVPDSGTSRTIVPYKIAKKLNLIIKPAIGETLRNASGKRMFLNGKADINMSLPGSKTDLLVDALISSDLNTDILVSWHDLESLGLINLSNQNSDAFQVSGEASNDPNAGNDQGDSKLVSQENSVESLFKEFPDVLTDTLPETPIKMEPIKIHIDPEKAEKYKPRKCLTARQRALAMEDACQNEVKSLVKKKIIRKLKINEVPKYIHPGFFIMKKNKKPRLVTDLTDINLITERPVHPFYSTAELLKKVDPSASWFCKLDFLQGFHQVPLDEESQLLTTFLLPEGTYCYTKTPMGLNISSDTFNAISSQLMLGLNLEKSSIRMIDDVCIWAKTKEELYEKVRRFLKRCQEYNVAISKSKFEIGQSVSFAGHTISKDGIAIAEDKIESIKSFPCPENVSELRSYMGLANHFSRHFCDLATVLEPLRGLLKKNIVFNMTDELKAAFEDSKKILCQSPVLQPFRKDLPSAIYCDASAQAFGFLLVQIAPDGKQHLICCGSRATKQNEKSWSTTDLELEALRYSLKQTSYYTRGLSRDQLTIYTDHRPLCGLFKRKLSDLKSPRQLRLRNDLQTYDFKLCFYAGKLNQAADILSRLPKWRGNNQENDNEEEEEFLTANIACLVECDAAAPLYLSQLSEAAETDKDYQAIISALKERKKIKDLPKDHPGHLFKTVWSELEVENGFVVLNNNRICVPKSMQKEILERIHLSHAGLNKSRRLAATYWYWPLMQSQLKNMVESCSKCQTFQQSNPTQKIQPEDSHATAYPMSTLALDQFTFQSDEYLSLVDRYSGFSWVYKLRSTTSSAIINVLDKIFYDFGFATSLQMDNCPNLKSQEMQDYCKENGIEAVYSSPFNSRSQGLAEGYIKIHKSMLAKSENFKDFLRRLRVFRNTPRSHEKFSPSELFFGRIQRTELPVLEKRLREKTSAAARDAAYRERISNAKSAYRKKKGQVLCNFNKNDIVLVQNMKTKEWDTKAKILDFSRDLKHHCQSCQDSHSRSYEILSDGKRKVRNRRFLKLFKKLDEADQVNSKTKSLANSKPMQNSIPTDDKSTESGFNQHAQITRMNMPRSCLRHAEKLDSKGHLFGESRPLKRRSKRLKNVKWGQSETRIFDPRHAIPSFGGKIEANRTSFCFRQASNNNQISS